MESPNYTCVIHNETLLLMSDKVTFKKIQDISESDEVMTIDINTTGTLDFVPTKIYNKYTKMSKKLYQVESKNKNIKMTADQLILAEWTFDVPYTCPLDKIHKGKIIYTLCETSKNVVLSVINNIYQVENEMVYYFTCSNNIFVTSTFIISSGEKNIFNPI
jgi:hypothetical protein